MRCRLIAYYKRIFSAVPVCAALLLTGCMDWNYNLESENFQCTGSGLFICNEGNFQYGNASLSFYDPANDIIENEVFFRANSMKLGDVAQSMTIYDNKGWIVVNNSHVIFAIDTDTFKEVGRIENLTSPRYIHFISPEKAYVTQLWDNRIFIVNPKRCEVTGYIEVGGMAHDSGSTEQMVQFGRYVYCTCWSYQNCILKIDTATDEVVDRLKIGVQPSSIVIDRLGKLWVLTDGGYEGSPYGCEAPALWCIDAESFKVERTMRMKLEATPSELCLDAEGDKLYWLDRDVMAMDIMSRRLPDAPFIEGHGTKYYGLTVSPVNGDVYVADAVDYQQQGMIYRYAKDGSLVTEFYAGVSPGAFCWKIR